MLHCNEVWFISPHSSSEGRILLGIITVTGALSKVKVYSDKEKRVQKVSWNLDPAYSSGFPTKRPCLLILSFASKDYLVKTELCLKRKRQTGSRHCSEPRVPSETEFMRKTKHVAKRHLLNYSCITNQPKYLCLNTAQQRTQSNEFFKPYFYWRNVPSLKKTKKTSETDSRDSFRLYIIWDLSQY